MPRGMWEQGHGILAGSDEVRVKEGGMMDGLEQLARDAFEEVTGYDWDDLKPTDELVADLGLDSLDMARLESELEDRLKIRIEPGYFNGVRTIGHLTESLKRLTETVH